PTTPPRRAPSSSPYGATCGCARPPWRPTCRSGPDRRACSGSGWSATARQPRAERRSGPAAPALSGRTRRPVRPTAPGRRPSGGRRRLRGAGRQLSVEHLIEVVGQPLEPCVGLLAGQLLVRDRPVEPGLGLGGQEALDVVAALALVLCDVGE